MTTQNDDDIQVLNDLITSLEDENAQIAQTMEEVKAKIESESAPFIQKVSDDGVKLQAIQNQADQEENAGQIQNVQDQISAM